LTVGDLSYRVRDFERLQLIEWVQIPRRDA